MISLRYASAAPFRSLRCARGQIGFKFAPSIFLLFVLFLTASYTAWAASTYNNQAFISLWNDFTSSGAPLLLTDTTNGRGLAVESVNWTREPFALKSSIPFSVDTRTRITVFARNLQLPYPASQTSLTADAEDGSHHIYPLTVEDVRPLYGTDGIYSVILRLNDEMDDTGDVLVRIYEMGTASNRIRIGIGHIGGGPADDSQPTPTPTPSLNPLPTISNLSSTNVIKGSTDLDLNVAGNGFVRGSMVRLNGSNRVTTFVSATLLTVRLLAADLSVEGSYAVDVVSPAPGGGTSNTAVFNVSEPELTISATPTPVGVSGRQFFVSPSGSATGDGSISRPWTLATALAQPATIKPGDTIWLRGGTYKGAFTSKLTGTASAPIIVRQYPGERAVIDQNIGASHARRMIINGAYTWYWGFEVMDSHPVRSTKQTRSDPTDVPREGAAVFVYGHHVKLINPIVHDLGDGIGFWVQSTDSEIYGALVFNNGWNAPDRGHGHGVYTQNQTGTKLVTDVVTFNNFATGMKAFGEGGYSIGYNINGLVSFNNGSPSSILRNDPGYRLHGLYIGSSVPPSDRISVTNSFLYLPPKAQSGNLNLGYGSLLSGRAVIKNNYVMGGSSSVSMKGWQSSEVTGNTLYMRNSGNSKINHSVTAVALGTGSNKTKYLINNNRYFDEGTNGYSFQFTGLKNSYGNLRLSFNEWRLGGGFDSASRYTKGRPTGSTVVVRPNRYEPGRAHVVVYNWAGLTSIKVDLSSSGLKIGDAFEIRDVQNLFGSPVFTGQYGGTPVTVPLTNRVVAKPIGMSTAPKHTGPEFFVFLVKRK